MFYQQAVSSFDNFTTWPKDLRDKLKKEIPFSTLKEIKSLLSKDKNTIKTLFNTEEGYPVETVLMKFRDGRNTVCISSMSGCPMACTFCATGQMDRYKNLTEREIVDQVLYFQRKVNDEDEQISNIVFVGMGEPMLNLENVISALKVLTDEDKMAYGSRRITVSTVGIIPQLEKFLFKNEFKGKLAISLHAPTQELREKLMPLTAKSNHLNQLLEVLDKYVERQNKKVTYEYILLNNINDQPEHAKQLVKILRDRLCLVNLINYNPSRSLPFEPTSRNKIANFMKILKENGINTTLRYSQGQDIQAACGQLASGDSPS